MNNTFLFSFRASMEDYGDFVPQSLKSSEDINYRALGEKLDLTSSIEESVYPVLNGTHAYLDFYSFTLILFWDTYQASN